MKKVSMFLFVLLIPSCNDSFTVLPSVQGRISVYVHWEGQALADKRLELIQTGETKFTDSLGSAEFDVTAGSYTIRAYGINRGGPSPRNIDFNVEVRSGETAHLDVVDCLPCV